MLLEQVKKLANNTLKAALMAAFFVSFLVFAEYETVDFSLFESHPPEDAVTDLVNGSSVGNSFNGELLKDPSYYCSAFIARGLTNYHSVKSVTNQSTTDSAISFTCWFWTDEEHSDYYSQNHSVSADSQPFPQCPPTGFSEFTYGLDENGDGVPDKCFNPQDFLGDGLGEHDAAELENYCDNLLIDSGNNTAENTCYTSNAGVSCEMQVHRPEGETAFNQAYYSGIGHKVLGCESSEYPEHDKAGIGNTDDGCVANHVGGVYCEANKNDHCNIVQGSEICDDGCYTGTDNKFMCDPEIHPDVGEGDSDYFDDSGSCSVVAGSAFKGACEELGGIWDTTTDYNEDKCSGNTITGVCSTGATMGCYSCLDSGGTWSPVGGSGSDGAAAGLDTTAIGLNNLISATESTNNKLDLVELSNRKLSQQIGSTIEGTSSRIEGKLSETNQILKDALGELKEINPEDESSTFTVTSELSDNSLLNSLFDDAAIQAIKTEQETLKQELSTLIDSINNEARALVSISVTGTGYQARTTQFTYGSVDLTLSRLEQFFILIGGAVLFAALVYSFIIIMGSRN